MSKAIPFLGATHDRARAFPGIDSVELSVDQDLWGHYTEKASQRQARYTLDNIPKRLRCVNPRCQQGGIDLQEIVVFWSNGEHSLTCNGHEGSPAGKRRGDPCDNSFVVRLHKVEK